MANLSPYLQFGGNCKAAMTFYQQCLGGNLYIQTIGESPQAANMPAESHNNVMHSDLRNNNLHLMASDMADPDEIKQGSVSLCLFSEDKDEIKTLFEKLSDGANVTTPLSEMPFGLYGDLTDKFGKRWMFQGGPMPQQ